MTGKSRDEIMAQVAQVAQEISSLMSQSGMQPLTKSHGYGVQKAGDEQEPPMPPQDGQDAGFDAPPPAPGEGDDQMPPQEGQEDRMGGPEEMAAQAKELSDEELDMMMQILSTEKASRGASHGEPDGDEGAGAPPSAPLEQSMGKSDADESGNGGEEKMEKGAKAEYTKMMKSMASVVKTVDGLAKTVANLEKQAKKAPIQKPVMTNRSQILEKSDKAPEAASKRLSKSDTINYALGQIRAGNQLFNSGVVSDLTLARSEQELHAIQDSLTTQGAVFPK